MGKSKVILSVNNPGKVYSGFLCNNLSFLAIEAKFCFYKIYVSKKLIFSKPADKDLYVYFKKLKSLSHYRLQCISLHIYFLKAFKERLWAFNYFSLLLHVPQIKYFIIILLKGHETCFFQYVFFASLNDANFYQSY